MIRVHVVARSPVARAGIEAMLGRGGDFEVLPGSGVASLAGLDGEPLAPDVVVLEAPGVGSAEDALDSLLEAWIDPPAVVVLLGGLDAATAAALLRAGARAVLAASASEEELRGGVIAAAAGLVALSGELADRLLPPDPESAGGAGTDVHLTLREQDVLDALAEGLSNKGIARRLGISEHTAKAHVAAILEKLGASTRTEAVTAGIRRGLVLL